MTLNLYYKKKVLIWTLSVLKEHLEKFIEVCKFPPKADAMCRHQHCLAHTIQIYFSDPDFKVSVVIVQEWAESAAWSEDLCLQGFIQLTCCQSCRVEFHMSCWKKLKTLSFSDKNDKVRWTRVTHLHERPEGGRNTHSFFSLAAGFSKRLMFYARLQRSDLSHCNIWLDGADKVWGEAFAHTRTRAVMFNGFICLLTFSSSLSLKHLFLKSDLLDERESSSRVQGDV